MGRKGRHARRTRVRHMDEDERPKGPTRTSVRNALVGGTLVAMLLLTLVIFAPGRMFPKETDHDQDIDYQQPPQNRPPIPKASATKHEVFVGENVTFDASLSRDLEGYIINYTWEFHQGWLTGPVLYSEHQRKFTRSFSEPGALYVVLTVEDDKGLTNSTVSNNQYNGLTINIQNRPPVAEAGANATTIVGKEVYFDGSKSYDLDGTIIEYLWNFGDNTTAKGDMLEHAYAVPGTYTVKLTVRDDHGDDGADTLQVIVQ